MVALFFTVSYFILVCLVKLLVELIGDFMRFIVRKVVKLVVYEEMMISVKNY